MERDLMAAHENWCITGCCSRWQNIEDLDVGLLTETEMSLCGYQISSGHLISLNSSRSIVASSSLIDSSSSLVSA